MMPRSNAAMQEPTPIRPSRWYYWLAPLFFAAGFGVFVLEIVLGVPQFDRALTQVLVPGKALLALQPGRSYTVYYESRSVLHGRIYETGESLNGLHCELRSSDDGQMVSLHRPDGPTKYRVGGRSGNSVLEFSVPRDGTYDFSCAFEPRDHPQEVVLAVGSGLGLLVLKKSLLGLFGIAGGGMLGVLSFFWVYILRDQAIARAAAQRQLPPPVR
jgi:hypothetical protein